MHNYMQRLQFENLFFTEGKRVERWIVYTIADEILNLPRRYTDIPLQSKKLATEEPGAKKKKIKEVDLIDYRSAF